MATDNNPFGDVTQMLKQFTMPGVDMTALVDAGRKDIEALVEANRAAYESMQAVAHKQTEMLTEAMHGIQEAAQGATASVGDPATQTAVIRKAFEKTMADMKELADMARDAQADALAHITKRGTEHMQEIRQLMQPK